jgi:hypothetical protein
MANPFSTTLRPLSVTPRVGAIQSPLQLAASTNEAFKVIEVNRIPIKRVVMTVFFIDEKNVHSLINSLKKFKDEFISRQKSFWGVSK